MEIIALILFISLFLLMMYGYPVAYTLGGLSLIYALCFIDWTALEILPTRYMSIMTNQVLIAVPLFVFMGVMLEKSGIAARLLETTAALFGRRPGGLAIAVIVVGSMLAASTGIVGATVVTMGLISLPIMLRRGYSPELATGTIVASGTLGQIIPPSIVLVLLGSVLQVSVGRLFRAALLPGIGLVVCYLFYVIARSVMRPQEAPSLSDEILSEYKRSGYGRRLILAWLLPLLLIALVLGSILAGIASPTEAAGLGAAGAIILAAVQRQLSLKVLQEACSETTLLTGMVFMILMGASCFGFVFRELGGDELLVQVISSHDLSPRMFLVVVMVLVFVAGFFIDFIEIIFIIVPIVAPLFVLYDMDLVWIGILLAMNLQTSFLTPPFGFSLFYLKGVAPPEVTTAQIYRGVLPYLGIQLLFLVLLMVWPEIIYLL